MKRLLLLCLLCLSGCKMQDFLTLENNVTVNNSGVTTTTATSGSSTANSLYFYDSFSSALDIRTLHNAVITTSGAQIQAASDAYVQYTLPAQRPMTVQTVISNMQATNGSKVVLLQLTDTVDAWVGENHVWQDSSLVEVRQNDTKLRFRVGGRGLAEFPTAYVADGLQYGAAYTLTLIVTATTADLSIDGQLLASFDASSFQPNDALYLFVGGGVGNDSAQGLSIQSVAVYL